MNWRSYLTEFVCTFVLCLTVLLSTLAGNWGIPLVGVVLTIIIYIGAPYSLAQYNPVVSMAFYLMRRMTLRETFIFILVQLSAAVIAALLFKSDLMNGETRLFVFQSTMKTIVAELVGTFALVYVIMQVACNKKLKGNKHYGFSIAGTVVVFAYLVGSMSGAAFNPSVALTLCISGTFDYSTLWMYLLAAVIASLLAVLLFKTTTKAFVQS